MGTVYSLVTKSLVVVTADSNMVVLRTGFIVLGGIKYPVAIPKGVA